MESKLEYFNVFGHLINLSLYRTLCDTLPRAVCQRGCNLFIDVQFTLVILAIELMKNSV
mgnify:CR=1 FL=1